MYEVFAPFNKKFVDLVDQVYYAPEVTEAASFHTLIDAYGVALQEEARSAPITLPMASLDAVQHALLHGSEAWKVLWVKALGHMLPNPLPILSGIAQTHPEVLSVMLSKLPPGSELPRHKGPFKGVRRYHFALQVPEGDCGIEVHGQPYKWREGRGVVFDDTLWHRAWNHTGGDRVVIFADVLRTLPPHLNAERQVLLGELATSAEYAQIAKVVKAHQATCA